MTIAERNAKWAEKFRFKQDQRRRAKEQRKSRICLSCDESFMSEGPHNRVCPSCKAFREGWGSIISRIGGYEEWPATSEQPGSPVTLTGETQPLSQVPADETVDLISPSPCEKKELSDMEPSVLPPMAPRTNEQSQ